MATLGTTHPPPGAAALLCMYSAKGWRTGKVKIIRHMIQKVAIQFNLSSLNEIKKEVTVLENQISTMSGVAEHEE